MSGDDGDLVEAQYTGQKAALRPIYTALIEKLRALGPDVEITPRKSLVSVRRKREFAILQPTSPAPISLEPQLELWDPTDTEPQEVLR